MAAFLALSLQLDTTAPYGRVYRDVDEGAWYTPFVEATGSHGLTDTRIKDVPLGQRRGIPLVRFTTR